MNEKTAIQIRDEVQSGVISAEEITSHYLAEIKQRNQQMNAYLSVFEERAMEKAKKIDQRRKEGKSLGKLAGLPIAIKDNILIKGEICSCGSKMLENFKSPYDATVIDLLEAEDAIFLGKTNMDEFAMGGTGIHSAFGSSKNPWDHALSPGGSSSGSSSAVSSGLAPIALGTDTGGSIRQPAAFTGMVGFKPTYGRVSRFGLVAFASSLDQIGPIARTVDDIALIMDVIGKHCPKDATSLNLPPINYSYELKQEPKSYRIGVPSRFLENLGGEERQNFEAGLDVIRSLGAEIVEIDLSILEYGIAVYYVLATAEASTNLARYDGIRYGYRDTSAQNLDELYRFSRSKGFGFEVKNRILLGTSVLSSGGYEEYYARAQKVRTLMIARLRESFAKCDLIAMPTTPSTAIALDGIKDPLQEYLQDLYTVGANLTGCPAISVPNGLSQKGKPFAMQFMGPQTKDLDVLRFAAKFQAVVPTKMPSKVGGAQ